VVSLTVLPFAHPLAPAASAAILFLLLATTSLPRHSENKTTLSARDAFEAFLFVGYAHDFLDAI